MVVQLNGKLIDRVEAPADASEEEQERARARARSSWPRGSTAGRSSRPSSCRDKLVNFVAR